jgi:ATP-dependent Clp protease ATP-binding subunit ClpA
MMFERFTEKAIKVVMLAQEESRRLGHNFVGTEQILLGLIGESTGISAKVLKSMGVTLKEARTEVEKVIGRGSGFVAVEIPFTPRAKRVLELSLEEARQLGTSLPFVHRVVFSNERTPQNQQAVPCLQVTVTSAQSTSFLDFFGRVRVSQRVFWSRWELTRQKSATRCVPLTCG